MRALVLFHQWETLDDAFDPIAIVGEVVWENATPEELQETWDAAKKIYALTEAPEDTFRYGWVTLTGVQALFQTLHLGTFEVDPCEPPEGFGQ